MKKKVTPKGFDEASRTTRVKMYKSGKQWVQCLLTRLGMIKLSSGVKPEEVKVETNLDGKTTSLLKGVLAASALIGGGVVSTTSALADTQTAITTQNTNQNGNQTYVDKNTVTMGSNDDSTSSESHTSDSDSMSDSHSDSTSQTSASESASLSAAVSQSAALSTSASLETSNSISASLSKSQMDSENLAQDEIADEQIGAIFPQLFVAPPVQGLPDHMIDFSYQGTSESAINHVEAIFVPDGRGGGKIQWYITLKIQGALISTLLLVTMIN